MDNKGKLRVSLYFYDHDRKIITPIGQSSAFSL